MNKNTIKGTMKQVEGSVESAFGKATGNTSAQIKGEAKKVAGKVQKAVGKADEGDI